jgi:hypothetical protein
MELPLRADCPQTCAAVNARQPYKKREASRPRDIRPGMWHDMHMLEFLSVRVAKIGSLRVHVHVPLRSRRPRGGLEDGLMPVDPEQPKGMSGGAAAALEFDD